MAFMIFNNFSSKHFTSRRVVYAVNLIPSFRHAFDFIAAEMRENYVKYNVNASFYAPFLSRPKW